MYLKFQFQWSSAGVLCVGALERLERIRVGFFPAMASHHSSALAAHCSKVWMDQCSWNRFAKVLCELYSNKDTDLCAVGYVNISICQMCTGCHCHPASAFLLGECAPSSLLGCGISAERAGTLLLPDTALQPPAYGGWHAELWHFLCVLRARKPKCCGVAGFVDYTHLYVCAMCTPTSPLRKAPPGSVALCPALSPVLLLWRLWTDVSLFPCSCPCSPVPVPLPFWRGVQAGAGQHNSSLQVLLLLVGEWRGKRTVQMHFLCCHQLLSEFIPEL